MLEQKDWFGNVDNGRICIGHVDRRLFEGVKGDMFVFVIAFCLLCRLGYDDEA